MSRIHAHATDLGPGAVVNRDFLVESVVGRGAFSTVYRAVQRSRKDRIVALKVLHRGIQRQIEGHAGRLKNPYLKEQLLCQRLKDPAVCRVIKVGTTDDERYFLALEWAEGVTLDRALQDHRAGMPFEVVASIVDQLGNALAEMHANRVVHRDLKPSNIMLQGGNGTLAPRVKILDFGIAKLGTEDDGSSGAEDELLIGTPAWMSPEQAAGRLTDARSDIFSLAAVAYEMLTRKRHIQIAREQRHTGEEYVRYLMSREPIPSAPVRAFRPDTPIDAALMIERSLSRDWNQRPRRVEEFVADVVPSLLTCASGPPRGGPLRRAFQRVFRRRT